MERTSDEIDRALEAFEGRPPLNVLAVFVRLVDLRALIVERDHLREHVTLLQERGTALLLEQRRLVAEIEQLKELSEDEKKRREFWIQHNKDLEESRKEDVRVAKEKGFCPDCGYKLDYNQESFQCKYCGFDGEESLAEK
jgi:predicted Zn-ribbon and HTH transcriptional regulator